MKKNGKDQQIKAKRQIKIPQQLIRKAERYTLQNIRQIEMPSKKSIFLNREQPRDTPAADLMKQAASISYISNRQTLIKSNQLSSKQQTSQIKFRTSGAGFRQRVVSNSSLKSYSSQRQIQTSHKIKKFQRSDKKIKMQPPQEQNFALREYILSRENYHRKRQQPPSIIKPKRRIIFGQNYLFQTKPEYQYNQKLTEEDIQWGDEINRFQKQGFGVNTNLSLYDLDSLEDPTGSLFLQSYLNKYGYCPYYKNKTYNWIVIKVIGFDTITSQAIVQRVQIDDLKKVSRLSIKLTEGEESNKKYWQRINKAKYLRKQVKQQQKYLRYIAHRKQIFTSNQFDKYDYSQQKKFEINQECYSRYSKQVLIYKEMQLKPNKFTDIGIRIRVYSPFKQKCSIPSDPQFQINKTIIQSKHYCKFSKFQQTFVKIYEKLSPQECFAFIIPSSPLEYKQLEELQCESVRVIIDKIHKKSRQIILSTIFGDLSTNFINKKEEKTYYRLLNYFYVSLLLQNLYEYNIREWCSFLNKFIRITTETPNPILKLSIGINLNSKSIQIEPIDYFVEKILLQPILLLQKKIQKIPDLLCDLLFATHQTKIKIDKSFLQSCTQVIRNVVDYSYTRINQFCKIMEDKLKYFDVMKFQKSKFSTQGKREYDTILIQLNKDLKEVQYAYIEISGLFIVNSAELKSVITENIIKQKQRICKLIERQINEEVTLLMQDFKKKHEELKYIPPNQEQLVKMRRYLNRQCQDFISKALEHYELCHEFYKFLEDHFYDYSPRQFQKFTETILEHSILISKINQKLNQLFDIERELIEKINSERESIMKGLEQILAKISTIQKYGNIERYNDYYVETSRNYYIIQSYYQQLQNINYRQRLLAQETSVFPLLPKVDRLIKPYFDLWNSCFEFLIEISAMHTKPIISLNFSSLQAKVINTLKQLQRLASIFMNLKNSEAVNICEILRERSEEAKNKLWIIESFTKQGMIKKQNIRKEVTNKIFKNQDVNFQQMSLEDLESNGVVKQKQFVIENARIAERVWTLEKYIGAIVLQMKKLEFVFQGKDGLQYLSDEQLVTLISAASEQLEVMEVIKSEEQASMIIKKVTSTYNRIKIIEDTLTIMSKFEQQFFPLRSLLGIAEIRVELQPETTVLNEIERIWKNMCNHFIRDCQVWECIDSESYKNRLESSVLSMKQINKKLSDLLNEKRLNFPRLFFISDLQLKQMLMNENHIILSNSMRLLFGGIKQLIREGDKLVGFKGYDQQVVEIKNHIGRAVIWQRLRILHEQIKKIMSWQINYSINKHQKTVAGRATKMLCEYIAELEDSITNKTNKILLQKINERISHSLKAKSKQNFYLNSIQIYFRDQLTQMNSLDISETTSFEWRKQIKYYRTENGGVELKTLSYSLNFQSEYSGNFIRPIFLNTDKVSIQTILSCRYLSTGCVIRATDQSIVSEMCQFTLHHYLEALIDDKITIENMIFFLKGTIFSEAWGVFIFAQKVQERIWWMLSKICYEVHQSLEQEKSIIKIGNSQCKVSKGFKMSLFLTSKYKQSDSDFQMKTNLLNLGENNYKFRVTFRQICLNLPSQSMRIRFEICNFCQKPEVEFLMKIYQLYEVKAKQINGKDNFYQLIKQLICKTIKSNRDQNLWVLQLTNLILQNLGSEASKQIISLITNFYENSNLQQTSFSEKQILQELICDIESKMVQKSWILIIGKSLSGKRKIIDQIFASSNRQISFDFINCFKINAKWLFLHAISFHEAIPLQNKVVFVANKLSNIIPSSINKFVIFYKHQQANWKVVLQYESKVIFEQKDSMIANQTISQLKIVIQTYFIQGLYKFQQQNIIAFILSTLKMINSLLNQNKIPTKIEHAKEVITLVVYWQVKAFNPLLRIKLNIFQSSFSGSNFQNYYYDTQKLAWLQWVTTLENAHYCLNTNNFAQLYLPLKETVNTFYFLSNIHQKYNIVLKGEENGLGVSRMIEKLSFHSDLIKIFLFSSRYTSFETVSALLDHNVNYFKKSGFYYPSQNKTVMVCIENLHLSDDQLIDCKMKILCNYDYDQKAKRYLKNIRHLIVKNEFTNKPQNIQFILSKSGVTIYIKQPDAESQQTIFSFYLEWFFGNTQNPFSKEVRNMAPTLIRLTLQIFQQFKKKYAQTLENKMLTFKYFTKIFQAITKCSPKTVKSSTEIFKLWHYELNRLFFDSSLFKGGKELYKAIIIDYLKGNSELSKDLTGQLSEVIHLSNEIFLKLPALNIEYSQTYRIVPKSIIFMHLRQCLESIDTSLVNKLPLIIYNRLLEDIVQAMRIFYLEGTNMLLYGDKKSCKKTLIRICSLLLYERDCMIIQNKGQWKEKLVQSLGCFLQIKTKFGIIFSLNFQYAYQDYLASVCEFLESMQFRSLVYDKNLQYLSALGFTSINTKRYTDFVKQCKKFINCFITLPSNSLQIIHQFPSLLKTMSSVKTMNTFDIDQKIQAAQVSVGIFYKEYTQISIIDSICQKIALKINNSQYLRILQLSIYYYQKSLKKIQRRKQQIQKALQKIRTIEKEKELLQRQLHILYPKLQKISQIVKELLSEFKQYQGNVTNKKQIYQDHQRECYLEGQKTKLIKQDVDYELSKVLPILKSAQDAMAKVTRDDINQLRSFPNPPLPAAKVVQSLIFVFNESSLVKQKVLEGGQKIRDFWQYAKKFILNDKLLKRVEQYKAEMIKDLDKNIINTLKQIIKKPQFVQQRVFKASIAAGNLSLWIKAIVSVYDAMQIIDPKRKILNAAEEALRVREFYLNAQLQQLNLCIKILEEKNSNYQQRLNEKQMLERKIAQIQYQISRGDQLLGLLKICEEYWNYQRNIFLIDLNQKCKTQVFYTSINIQLLSGLNNQQKNVIVQLLKQAFKGKKSNESIFLENQIINDYKKIFLELEQSDDFNEYMCPLHAHFLQPLICLHENLKKQKRINLVIDETSLLVSYLTKIEVKNKYQYNIELIDCLAYGSLKQLLHKRKIRGQQLENNNSNIPISNMAQIKQYTNIVIITNIEFLERAIQDWPTLINQINNNLLVVVATRMTKQLQKIVKSYDHSIQYLFQLTPQIINYCLRKKLCLSIPQIQQLAGYTNEIKIKHQLVNVLCKQQDILYHNQVIDEWIIVYRQFQEIRKAKPVFKKMNKIQSETLNEIVNFTEWKNHMDFSNYLAIAHEYCEDRKTIGQQAIWTFRTYIQDQMSKKHTKTIIHVVFAEQKINLLAYYLMYQKGIKQIGEALGAQDRVKGEQLTPLQQIKCQIISLDDMVYALKSKLQIFFFVENNFLLWKVVSECYQIYQTFLKQTEQQVDEKVLKKGDKKNDKRCQIYLLSNKQQIPLFPQIQMAYFTQKRFLQLFSQGGDGEQTKSEHFDQLYQFFRHRQKFSFTTKQQKAYMERQLFGQIKNK